MQQQQLFTILHFNDVYDIQETRKSGGICSFKVKVQQLRKQYPNSLLLFSGDAFSPSILTNIKEGWQMVKALNELGIDAACYGNHEFDFPQEHSLKLAAGCNFPWLLGNIVHSQTRQILGKGKPYLIREQFGLRIGIYGVAGNDWLGILADYYEGELDCIDSVNYSHEVCSILRDEHKCDMIIALTHMRNAQDLELARQVSQIDIILGGHDHVIMKEVVKQIPVIKSGCNFFNMGAIRVFGKQKPQQTQGLRWNYQIEIHKVERAPVHDLDPDLLAYVNGLAKQYEAHNPIVGYTDAPLQTRFDKARVQEINYGNFLADLVRYFFETDIALINSGCIRNDALIPVGPLKYSQVSNLINDALIVKLVSGKKLYEALEYGMSGLPDGFKGSFMQVSGIKVYYDPCKPMGSKIKNIEFHGRPIDLQREYRVGTYSYIGRGGDGFSMLKDCGMCLDEVQTMSMLNLILKFFKGVDLSEITDKKEVLQSDNTEYELPEMVIRKRSSAKVERIAILRHRTFLNEEGRFMVSICPTTQKRLVVLNDKQH